MNNNLNFNKALIAGVIESKRVTSSQAGKPVVNLEVSTFSSWKDKKTGEQRKATETHKVVIWGDIADFVANRAHEGMHCFVEGRIQYRNYEKDGAKKYITEINASMFHLSPDGPDEHIDKEQPPLKPFNDNEQIPF